MQNDIELVFSCTKPKEKEPITEVVRVNIMKHVVPIKLSYVANVELIASISI